jgi:hypothetical protein
VPRPPKVWRVALVADAVLNTYPPFITSLLYSFFIESLRKSIQTINNYTQTPINTGESE